MSVADFIRALNFPDSPEDRDGFRALRRALEDRTMAKLIRAAQDVLTLSVQQKESLGALLELLIQHLPAGEPFFDSDMVTDAYEREIAAELIRESVLMYVHDEVPHCVAVQIESYEERPDDKAYIEATLFVERDSQKGILVGKSGEMIKNIGTRSRQEIEAMSGRKVFLDLRVKLNKNWRNSPEALELLGYNRKTE